MFQCSFLFQVGKFIMDHVFMLLITVFKLNPNPVNLVFYQHALLLCLCSWPGLLCSSRRVTGLGLSLAKFMMSWQILGSCPCLVANDCDILSNSIFVKLPFPKNPIKHSFSNIALIRTVESNKFLASYWSVRIFLCFC